MFFFTLKIVKFNKIKSFLMEYLYFCKQINLGKFQSVAHATYGKDFPSILIVYG